MKMAVKFAGIYGTGAFLLVAYPAYVNSLDANKVFLVGIPAFLVAAWIGYQMGQIFSNPKGQGPKPKETEQTQIPSTEGTHSEPDLSVEAPTEPAPAEANS